MEFDANHLSDLDKELAAIERDLERHGALEAMSSGADYSGFSGALTANDITAMQAPMAGIEDFDRRISALLAKAAAIDGIEAGIESMGKISLRDVSSLEKLVPGMIYRNGVDSSQFTLNPSTQGYAAGLEAINMAQIGKWGLIGVIVVAVLAIIAKLFGVGNQAKSMAEDVSAKLDDVERKAEKVRQMEERIRREQDEARQRAAEKARAWEEEMKQRDHERKVFREAMDAKVRERSAELDKIKKDALNSLEQNAFMHFDQYLQKNPRFDKKLIPKHISDFIKLRIEDVYKEDHLAETRDNFFWTAKKSDITAYVDFIKSTSEALKKYEVITQDRQLSYSFIETADEAFKATSARIRLLDRTFDADEAGSADKVMSLWQKLIDTEWANVFARTTVSDKLGGLVKVWQDEAEARDKKDGARIRELTPMGHGFKPEFRKLDNPTIDSSARLQIKQALDNDEFHQGNYIQYFEHYNRALKGMQSGGAYEQWGNFATSINASELPSEIKTKLIASLSELKGKFNAIQSNVTAYMRLCQSTMIGYGKALQSIHIALNHLSSHYSEKEIFQAHQRKLVDAITAKEAG